MGDSTTMSLTEVMDRLRSATDGSRMTVGDIFQAFGSRAYGPLIFVLGVIALSPIGSIPGASLVTGTLIMLLAAQMQLRAGSPWIPGVLRRIGTGSDRARRSIDWADRHLAKVDRVVGPRWQWAETGWTIRLAGLAILALAATFYPLAFVPWGVVPPALAVTLLSLGLFTRDGLILLIGLGTALAAGFACFWLLG
ncbi:exopolysaccharide biosynthesis protein [Marinibaculum pumilum]|uniref:Exopolysaccharide biosynthesis protein n=1 Tax=Marinibaculum pumilum TaxID=1766165 RepID=A0ABV7L7N2_9PROT